MHTPFSTHPSSLFPVRVTGGQQMWAQSLPCVVALSHSGMAQLLCNIGFLPARQNCEDAVCGDTLKKDANRATTAAALTLRGIYKFKPSYTHIHTYWKHGTGIHNKKPCPCPDLTTKQKSCKQYNHHNPLAHITLRPIAHAAVYLFRALPYTNRLL